MAKRKIASQTEAGFVSYDTLNIPQSRVLTESLEHEGDTYLPGQLDPTYRPEPEAIWLMTLDGVRYDSIHGDYTASKIPHATIEKSLDGHFTNTVLLYNHQVKQAVDADPTYATWLGLPAMDPEMHVKDLNVIPAHAEAESMAYIAHTMEWKAQQEAIWEATDPDYAARLAAGEIVKDMNEGK